MSHEIKEKVRNVREFLLDRENVIIITIYFGVGFVEGALPLITYGMQREKEMPESFCYGTTYDSVVDAAERAVLTTAFIAMLLIPLFTSERGMSYKQKTKFVLGIGGALFSPVPVAVITACALSLLFKAQICEEFTCSAGTS